MPRYIDADALKKELFYRKDSAREWYETSKAKDDKECMVRADSAIAAFIECILTLKNMPTVDAVEVVRCKDCGYWGRETVRQNSNDAGWWNEAICKCHSIDGDEPHKMWTPADWFCADGERRTDGK